MTANNATYYKLKNAHLCVYCGVALADEYDRIACPSCMRHHAEQARSLRSLRRDQHLCINCGAIMHGDEKVLYCKNCRDAIRNRYYANRKHISEYNRKRREDRKANGLCINCGKPAVPGLTRCEKHRLMENARERRRRFKSV